MSDFPVLARSWTFDTPEGAVCVTWQPADRLVRASAVAGGEACCMTWRGVSGRVLCDRAAVYAGILVGTLAAAAERRARA